MPHGAFFRGPPQFPGRFTSWPVAGKTVANTREPDFVPVGVAGMNYRTPGPLAATLKSELLELRAASTRPRTPRSRPRAEA